MNQIKRFLRGILGIPTALSRYRPPIFVWLPKYSTKDLRSDLNAGITVFVLLVPQGMAYAILAGLPPVYGLYCVTIPLFVYCIFGTSKQLAISAMAITSLISSTTVQDLGYETKSSEFIKASIALALWTGLVQIIMGLLGLGILANYLSPSVLVGFTTGAGLIVALSQLKYVLGLTFPSKYYSHETIGYILTHLQDINVYGIVIGVCVTAILYYVKINRRIYKEHKIAVANQEASILRGDILEGPRFEITAIGDWAYKLSNLATTTAVVVSTLVSFAIHQSVRSDDVNMAAPPIVGMVPSGLPSPSIPTLDMTLLPGGVTLAIISFAGNWAIAKKFARENRYEVSAREELIATGMSNMVGSLFRSFVVAGALAGSSLNAESGARTPLSGVISALCIIVTLLFLTELFFYLPMATLGAIIVVAIVSMFDFDSMWRAFKEGAYWDTAIMVVTCACTFFASIPTGLGVGVGLSFLAFFFRLLFPQVRTTTLILPTSLSTSHAYSRDVQSATNEELRSSVELGSCPRPWEKVDVNSAVCVVLVDMGISIVFANCMKLKEKVQEVIRPRVGRSTSRHFGSAHNGDLKEHSSSRAEPDEREESDNEDKRKNSPLYEMRSGVTSRATSQSDPPVLQDCYRAPVGCAGRDNHHQERDVAIDGNGNRNVRRDTRMGNEHDVSTHYPVPANPSHPSVPHAVVVDAGSWGNSADSLDLPTIQMLRDLVIEVQSFSIRDAENIHLQQRKGNIRFGFVNMHPLVRLRLQEFDMVSPPITMDGLNRNRVSVDREIDAADCSSDILAVDTNNLRERSGGRIAVLSRPAWDNKKIDSNMFFSSIGELSQLLPHVLKSDD